MSVDLRLLIVEHLHDNNGMSRTILEWGSNRDLHDLINSKAFDQPLLKISTYFGTRILNGEYKGERTYGDIIETPYGERMRFIKAGDMYNLPWPIDLDCWYQACLAFIGTIPPDTLIGLYYH